MKLRVKVKEKHIRAAKEYGYYNAYSCPVARALKEVCPNYEFGVYGLAGRQIGIKRDKADIYDLYKIIQPRSVQRFVSTFDNTLTGKPFQFILEVPDEVVCND